MAVLSACGAAFLEAAGGGGLYASCARPPCDGPAGGRGGQRCGEPGAAALPLGQWVAPARDRLRRASRQIFNLMKFDSYARFLKSQLYQECILAEVEGRALPDAQHVPSSPTSKHSGGSDHSNVSTPKKVPGPPCWPRPGVRGARSGRATAGAPAGGGAENPLGPQASGPRAAGLRLWSRRARPRALRL